jgi:hypothetical protein
VSACESHGVGTVEIIQSHSRRVKASEETTEGTREVYKGNESDGAENDRDKKKVKE